MKQSLTAGTLMILCAGLIIKTIGFMTRLFISNTVGAEGMGLYQLFFPFYSLVILTLTSGISIAQTAMISRESTKQEWQNVRKITAVSMILSLGISFIVAVGIYGGASNIGMYLFKDERLTLSLKLFAPFIPIIALGAVIRAYFYGTSRLGSTGISGIVEQIVRIMVIVGLASSAINFGLEYACLILVLGLVAGETANMAVLTGVYLFRRDPKNTGANTMPRAKMLREILHVTLPVSINRFLTSALGAMEVIWIKNALIHTGFEYNYSLEEFGRLTGMVMPLIYFPMVFSNAIATSMVPAIAQALAVEDLRRCRHRISKALLFSVVSGVVFTSVFLAYATQIGRLLYHSERCGEMIFGMAFACTFLYLQQTLTGILNGLSKQGVLLGNTLVGFILRFGSIVFLIPVWGMQGYIVGFVLSSAVICFFNLAFLKKALGMTFEVGRWMFRPMLIGGGLLFSAETVEKGMQWLLGNQTLGIAGAIAMLVGGGYFFMFLWRVLDISEMGFFDFRIKKHKLKKGDI